MASLVITGGQNLMARGVDKDGSNGAAPVVAGGKNRCLLSGGAVRMMGGFEVTFAKRREGSEGERVQGFCFLSCCWREKVRSGERVSAVLRK